MGFGDSPYGIGQFGGGDAPATPRAHGSVPHVGACDTDGILREIPDLAGGLPLAVDLGLAVLVETTDQSEALTARADADVHGSICVGLASYVAGLRGIVAGRDVSITRVLVDWADHDDGSVESPTAVVTSTEDGKYADDGGMGLRPPIPIDRDVTLPGRILALAYVAHYQLEELRVEAYCEDKIQRSGVRRMLEGAFAPVDWMTGFMLVLPGYHNARCEFELKSAQQADAADDAGRGVWPLVMTLSARCPVYRAHSRPLAHPSAVGTIGVSSRRP